MDCATPGNLKNAFDAVETGKNGDPSMRIRLRIMIHVT